MKDEIFFCGVEERFDNMVDTMRYFETVFSWNDYVAK